MNRKLILDAISGIDDRFIAEAMCVPADQDGHLPERTTVMENKFARKHIYSRRLATLIFAACLVFALAATAYAADIGGIQRRIQIWRYGNQTTVVLDVRDGAYTMTDADGRLIQGGGGVAIEADGAERPLTEAELMEHLDRPDLCYKEDGTVWLYYHGQKIELTDRFDADGVCYLELRNGEETLYVTVKEDSGMAISSSAYIQPWSFNTVKEP